MIVKPYTHKAHAADPRQRAGDSAEKQMAHYLHRAFRDDPEVQVLHNLRIVDPQQPEHDASPGVCQIDHLIVHRWGLVIVESKSVTEEVHVRPDGTGGDEWTRVYQGKKTGMQSPIQQAALQGEFLRSFLQRHRTELVGRHSFGLRTIARIKLGTDQRGFMDAPIQLVIAISDGGTIRRLDGWEESRKPFQVFVAKADAVTEKIEQELERHRKGANLLRTRPEGEYGLWYMEPGEPERVAKFLAERHTDRAPKRKPTDRSRNRSDLGPDRGKPGIDAQCGHCGSQELSARWGKYGYHWRCAECAKNTKMPVVCSACGAERRRDQRIVKIRKEAGKYFRECQRCGTSEMIWSEE